MDYVNFIMAIEDGSMTEDYFYENAQTFVDSGIWRNLQGSWQRMVMEWANQGLVEI